MRTRPVGSNRGASADAGPYAPGVAMVWIDGWLGPADEARLSPLDHGFLVGDGVFETLRVLSGQPFAITRHLRRLHRSADALGIGLPPDDGLRTAIDDVIAANGLDEGRLRLTVTTGAGPLGSERGETAPTVAISAGPQRPWPPRTAVATVPWTRNERGALAGLKTTSYAENVRALARARAEGATEAVFANTAGDLCEGTGSNVFLVVDGRLVTPTLAAGCLAGVTRELVLEITDAVEADVPLAALAEAEEAFLTSTTRDVHPISHVDGRALPTCPGPATRRAADAFAAVVARTLDP